MLKKYLKNKLAGLIVSTIEGLDTKRKANLFVKLKEAFFTETYNAYRKKYTINNNFRFNGDNIMLYGNGTIACGSNSYIGSYSTIQASDNYEVKIGDNCSVSHNVRIYTSSNIADQDLNNSEIKTKKNGHVIIHNGVWIGANVFINPDVVIGENSIIGANSVVTKNIESNAIYGGVPAKLIRYKGRIV